MNKDVSLKKKILMAVLIAALTAVPLKYVHAEENEETADENRVTDGIIVVYDDAGMSEKRSEAIQKDAELSLSDKDIYVTEEISEADDVQGTIVTAEIPEDMDVQEAVDIAMEEEAVSFAQPNYIYQTLENGESEQEVVNDPYVQENQTYYLDNAHIKEAWKSAEHKNSVTVAVLDTGCRLDHEDLKDNISEKAYDVYYNKPLTTSSTDYKGDAEGTGNLGHGTHVCGLIAATANNGVGIAGTSYNAKVLPVKIFDDNGEGATTKTLLDGMEYCRKLIDNNEIDNLRIINLSVGVYSEKENQGDILLEKEISTLADEYNILCVCAGGNGKKVNYIQIPRTDAMYPSDYDTCLSVTGLDESGNDISWSDYNMAKDISAPGLDICSTFCEGESSYKKMSGTSMSAPIVSGICALLWSEDSSLTVAQVKEAIINSADPMERTSEDARNGKTGSAGAVNALAALEYIRNGGTSQKKSIRDADIQLSDESYTYSGERKEPEVTVKSGEEELIRNQDYKVYYSNNLEAGTAKANIQGINNYKGTAVKEFTINKVDISVKGTCKYYISSKNITYTGDEIKPTIRVSFNGEWLEENQDFTLTYSDNINVGTAKVTIRGCGNNFTGGVYISYNIIEVDEGNPQESLPDSSNTSIEEMEPVKATEIKQSEKKEKNGSEKNRTKQEDSDSSGYNKVETIHSNNVSENINDIQDGMEHLNENENKDNVINQDEMETHTINREGMNTETISEEGNVCETDLSCEKTNFVKVVIQLMLSISVIGFLMILYLINHNIKNKKK